MTTARKSADKRLKDLRLAMHRIQRGRAHTGATKVSILAIAKEAGVSDSLIHNHYPKFAEEVEVAKGRSVRKQRDEKHEELKAERVKNKLLRDDLALANARIDKLASINESLSAENNILKARLASPKVLSLKPVS
jgi:AcrR family transcriptional regulator